MQLKLWNIWWMGGGGDTTSSISICRWFLPATRGPMTFTTLSFATFRSIFMIRQNSMYIQLVHLWRTLTTGEILSKDWLKGCGTVSSETQTFLLLSMALLGVYQRGLSTICGRTSNLSQWSLPVEPACGLGLVDCDGGEARVAAGCVDLGGVMDRMTQSNILQQTNIQYTKLSSEIAKNAFF